MRFGRSCDTGSPRPGTLGGRECRRRRRRKRGCRRDLRSARDRARPQSDRQGPPSRTQAGVYVSETSVSTLRPATIGAIPASATVAAAKAPAVPAPTTEALSPVSCHSGAAGGCCPFPNAVSLPLHFLTPCGALDPSATRSWRRTGGGAALRRIPWALHPLVGAQFLPSKRSIISHVNPKV